MQLLITFMYVCVDTCIHTTVNMWRSEDSSQESGLSFHCVSLSDGTRVTRISGRQAPLAAEPAPAESFDGPYWGLLDAISVSCVEQRAVKQHRNESQLLTSREAARNPGSGFQSRLAASAPRSPRLAFCAREITLVACA